MMNGYGSLVANDRMVNFRKKIKIDTTLKMKMEIIAEAMEIIDRKNVKKQLIFA